MLNTLLGKQDSISFSYVSVAPKWLVNLALIQ